MGESVWLHAQAAGVKALYQRQLVRGRVYAVDGSGLGDDFRLVALVCVSATRPIIVAWRLLSGQASEKGQEAAVTHALIDQVLQVAGPQSISLLLADALYADGPLLAWLKYSKGIDALVSLPEDRLLYQDLQRLGQPCPTGGVDLQSGACLAQRQVHTHQAPVGLLRQRIERQPARERGARLLQLPIGLLPGGEPIAEQLQAHLPLALLQPHPLVKGSFLAQPEAVEERTARQGKRVLDLGDQGGALWLSGDCGEPLDLCVGLLHHPHVQLQRGLRVQTEQLMLTEQMGVLGISVVEQAA